MCIFAASGRPRPSTRVSKRPLVNSLKARNALFSDSLITHCTLEEKEIHRTLKIPSKVTNTGFFFTKFLEDLVGPTLRQAEFFVLSFEFFSYSEFFWAEDTK